MRGLLAVILAASVVACGAALLDFVLFLNHPTLTPIARERATLWTCVRIAGGHIGCLSD